MSKTKWDFVGANDYFGHHDPVESRRRRRGDLYNTLKLNRMDTVKPKKHTKLDLENEEED